MGVPTHPLLNNQIHEFDMIKIVWIGWWGGNLLIVLAWFRQVPPAFGWAGFAIAVAAFLAPLLLRRLQRQAGSKDSSNAAAARSASPTSSLSDKDT